MLARGRLPAVKLEIGTIRPLVPDDLLCLRQKRTTPNVQRMRDPHHRLARLLATGLRPKDAAEQTGYSKPNTGLELEKAIEEYITFYNYSRFQKKLGDRSRLNTEKQPLHNLGFCSLST